MNLERCVTQSLRILSFVLIAVSTYTANAHPTKIMLVGDSITHGDGGVGYRYFLYRDLIDYGFSDFDFVGPHDSYFEVDPGDLANDYPLYFTDFDRDHEGHSGWQTSTHLSGNHLLGSLQTYAPDIVSIMLGTNDLGANPNNPNAEQNAINNLGTIVGQIRSVNANAKILLTQIVPIQEGKYNNQGYRVPGYNAMLATFAANTSTAQSPIELVDQYTGFDARGMMYDGIHPNVYGEQLVGDRYFVAMQQFLAPGDPVISPDIKIHNASFEDYDPYDGVIDASPVDKAFGFTQSSVADSGVLDPRDNTYSGANGNGTPQGADGSMVGYVFNKLTVPDASQLPEITQQLSHLLQPDSDYTLEVAVGNRGPNNQYLSHYGGYEIELLAGGTVIGSETNEITPQAGTFEDVSFTVTTANLDPMLLGKELSIRLTQTDLTARAATDFDNIRLTKAPSLTNVPEPFSLLPLILASGLLALKRRQR